MTQVVYTTDHELRTAIVEELAWTPSVHADEVGVSVNSGAVTLSGQVETYPEKREAVRAAMRVRGAPRSRTGSLCATVGRLGATPILTADADPTTVRLEQDLLGDGRVALGTLADDAVTWERLDTDVNPHRR